MVVAVRTIGFPGTHASPHRNLELDEVRRVRQRNNVRWLGKETIGGLRVDNQATLVRILAHCENSVDSFRARSERHHALLKHAPTSLTNSAREPAIRGDGNGRTSKTSSGGRNRAGE